MAKIKICLDAGHYGKYYNQSPANTKYYESEMMWKLHLLLKKHLEAYGIEVVTTRSSIDKDMDLTTRGKTAQGCNLFLSLHSNAVGDRVNEKVDYPIALVPISGKGDELGKKLADCVQKTMGTQQDGRIEARRGSNGDYYGVIRGATAVGVVGIILEHSFHTNTKAVNWLMNANNLEKLAQAEADLLAAHFGATKKVKWYRVQAGAFARKDYAEAQCNALQKAGFNAIIVESE